MDHLPFLLLVTIEELFEKIPLPCKEKDLLIPVCNRLLIELLNVVIKPEAKVCKWL